MPACLDWPTACLHVPDGRPLEDVLQGVRQVGVGAHPDDLEFMALPAIAQAQAFKSFFGIVVTDGRSSPRGGPYAGMADLQMVRIRTEEQCAAADQGRYGAVVLLGMPSAILEQPEGFKVLVGALVSLLKGLPQNAIEALWTHAVTDRHRTHRRVAQAVIQALSLLSKDFTPAKFLGGEVWGSLDGFNPQPLCRYDVSLHVPLAKRLIRCFDSQIQGAKAYEQALLGRWQANATFADSHSCDTASHVCLAVDQTPLVAPGAPVNLEAFAKTLLPAWADLGD
jgi:LmbE family N-acetylglucosaminyl deacetylase